MTDQELMMRRRRMNAIGGERVTTEKKQRATTHDVKEQRSTKPQGPSLTNSQKE
jgi:hypothetical protein